MYSVCIADDEALIQKSISTRLRTSGTPVKVIGCADNAMNAINLYWDSKPDIFFVDINMPGIDGLSMIRRIREEDPACKTKFIIITGYDDFAHLREAIQSGVIDYLKKPISTDEFNSVLASVTKTIQSENRNKWKSNEILYYDDYLTEPPQILNGGTFLAVFCPDADIFSIADKKISGLWEHGINDRRILRLAFQGMDYLGLYYLPDHQISKTLILKTMNEFVINNGAFLAYSYPESERLDNLVERAEQTINKRFMINTGIAECPCDIKVSEADLGILDYALEHGQPEACRAALNACFNETMKKDAYFRELSSFYRKIILLCINKYASHKLPIPDYLKLDFSLFALCRYRSLQSLQTRLCGMVLSLVQKIGSRERGGELIKNVCDFLKENYAKELTLNDLAGQFYVSIPYLSRRFREKTGLTYVEYLENIRMDKAREYLINSEAQIADVSEQVGYMDPAYFAKIFKRKYELSPSEYRSRNRL